MSWTISHRQAGVTRSDIGGLIRHNFRDVDRQNSREISHSNERIRPGLTPLNESFIYKNGEAFEISDTSEILEELDARLATVSGTRTNRKTGVTKPTLLRSSAGVVREIVLTLDPQFSRSSAFFIDNQEAGDGQHADEVRKHFSSMLAFYADLYGEENLLASSLHLDETTPHMHLFVTPIAEVEGIRTIRQESFIPAGRGSKSGMAKNDLALRQWMIERGYDADPEPRRLTTNNMSAEELEALRLATEKAVALEDKEKYLETEARDLDFLFDVQKGVDDDLKEREKQLEERAAQLDLVAQQQQRLQRELEKRERAVETAKQEIPEMKRRARSEGYEEGREEGLAAGQAEADDLVARQQQQLAAMSRAHAKRLSDLEEQAKIKYKSYVQAMPSIEDLKDSMSGVAVEFISSYLDERLPNAGVPELFERYISDDYTRRVKRQSPEWVEKRLSLEEFKAQPLSERRSEQVKRTQLFRQKHPDVFSGQPSQPVQPQRNINDYDF